jgi:hypothetical protein
VHAAEAERERRREEDGLLLGRRQVGGLRDLAADGARELLAVGVDEAGLADARRIELLEVAQMMRDLREVATVAARERAK